jgi:hypothetical protein
MNNRLITSKWFLLLFAIMFYSWGLASFQAASAQTLARWKAHDLARPHPPVVTPVGLSAPHAPPSDAIVLFDGTDLSRWCSEDGGPATWIVEEGAMVPSAKGGDIYTIQPFGDVQLHVEWASPSPPRSKSQGRGNSGVFLMGLYEIQILDSYENETYADGQAAALYGQYPPLVNACRPAGEWQTFDIVFRRPRFLPDGTLANPARMTAFHNGILVQDAAEFWGPTMWLQHLPYTLHPDKLPISLQDHGNPVRFRNIWLRELREHEEPGPGKVDEPPAFALNPDMHDRYVGTYKFSPESESAFSIISDGRQLYLEFGKEHARVDLVPNSLRRFSMRFTAAHLDFDLDDEGTAGAMTFNVAGTVFTVKRVE